MTDKAAISVNDITVTFGSFTALSDVSFDVPTGAITGLLGPNGAGKSTLFNAMTGVVAPASGTVIVNHENLVGLKPHEVARRRVARTFQTPRGFPSLSVYDNVAVAIDDPSERLGPSIVGRRPPESRRELVMSALDGVGLSSKLSASYGHLSAGETRLLEVARHLVRDPEYWLLDEPTAGVTPELQDRLFEVVMGRKAEGKTILCVEHNMAFLRRIADFVVVIERGRVIAQGSPEVVLSDERVITAYLGDRGRRHVAD